MITNDTSECSLACFHIKDILACFLALSQLPDLNPSPEVDSLFGKLVHLCRQMPGERIVNKVNLTLPSLLAASSE